MQLTNSISEYGLVSKLFHWLTFVALLIQIPMGFYLVDLDYSDYRIFIEDIHVTLGLSIFYLVLFRLLYKLINPTPALPPAIFSGQKVIAKLKIVYDDELVGEYDLYAKEEIKRLNIFSRLIRSLNYLIWGDV